MFSSSCARPLPGHAGTPVSLHDPGPEDTLGASAAPRPWIHHPLPGGPSSFPGQNSQAGRVTGRASAAWPCCVTHQRPGVALTNPRGCALAFESPPPPPPGSLNPQESLSILWKRELGLGEEKEPQSLHLGDTEPGAGWGGAPMPPGAGRARAGGLGTGGNPGQSPSTPPGVLLLPPQAMPCPPLGVPGVPVGLDRVVPSLQGPPSPRVPGCPHSSTESRTATSAFILPCLLSGCPRWASGAVGSGTKGVAEGFPDTLGPQLQPRTMGFTPAPGPGAGPEMATSLPDSRAEGGGVLVASLGVSRPPVCPGHGASALRGGPASPPPHVWTPRPGTRPHSCRSWAPGIFQSQTTNLQP